jgi:hypothetical protein
LKVRRTSGVVLPDSRREIRDAKSWSTTPLPKYPSHSEQRLAHNAERVAERKRSLENRKEKAIIIMEK